MTAVLLAMTLLCTPTSQEPCAPSPRPPEAPSLVVRVLDPADLPVPGADVTVTSTGDPCRTSTSVTDRDGYARFWLPADGRHEVQTFLPGFKRRKVKGVQLRAADAGVPVALALKLKLAGPAVTVY
jgi:hypothetical protein